MKQGFAIFLSILLMLSFCGCRPSGLHGSNTAATESATTAPTRPETIQLEFFLEGMGEYQDATLYVGDGYSLYIPDDNWVQTPGQSGEMTWVSGYNPDILLRVIPNAGERYDQVRDALFQGYTDISEEGEYVFGRDASGRLYRAARLIKTSNGILAAVWDYTFESIEGFGARLYVIAGTLEITQQ